MLQPMGSAAPADFSSRKISHAACRISAPPVHPQPDAAGAARPAVGPSGRPDASWPSATIAPGLALGGNKNRKLEFILGEAIAAGADTLVTAGGVQSNHCRQTAAAAARHGLKCELVLSRNVASNHPEYDRTGNVLLDRIFGAGLNFVPRDIDWATELEKVAEVVRQRGGKPFVIPIGGSTPTGALGYVGCAQEILQQAAALGTRRRCRGPLLRQRRHAIRPAGRACAAAAFR